MSEENSALEQKLAEHGKQSMTVAHKDTDEKVTIDYDFGDNLDDAVAKYGADAVFYNYVIGAKDSLRNKLGALIRHNEVRVTADEARQQLADWTPGVGSVRASKDPVATASKELEKMSEEQIAALLQLIQAKRSAAAAG